MAVAEIQGSAQEIPRGCRAQGTGLELLAKTLDELATLLPEVAYKVRHKEARKKRLYFCTELTFKIIQKCIPFLTLKHVDKISSVH